MGSVRDPRRAPLDSTSFWLLVAGACFIGSCACLNGVALLWIISF